MYQIRQIARVKQLREERLLNLLGQQIRAYNLSKTESEQAELRLRDYRKFAKQREDSIYRQLCERPTRLSGLQVVNSELHNLRKVARERDRERQAAQEDLAQQESKLRDAKHAHGVAVVASEKAKVSLAESQAMAATAEEHALDLLLEETAQTRWLSSQSGSAP